MPSEIQLSALQAVVAAAQASARKWGVSASVTLAQWIFESTWGTSQLALKANNFFGIKAEHLDQPDTYEEFPTHEYVAGKLVLVEADFEKYSDALGSFDDHGRLLATASRYKAAMAFGANPTQFAAQIAQAGYSTDPEYCNKLLTAIRQEGLMRFEIAPPVAAAASEV